MVFARQCADECLHFFARGCAVGHADSDAAAAAVFARRCGVCAACPVLCAVFAKDMGKGLGVSAAGAADARTPYADLLAARFGFAGGGYGGRHGALHHVDDGRHGVSERCNRGDDPGAHVAACNLCCASAAAPGAGNAEAKTASVALHRADDRDGGTDAAAFGTDRYGQHADRADLRTAGDSDCGF